MSIAKRFSEMVHAVGLKRTLEAAVGMVDDIRFDRSYSLDTLKWHKLTTNDVDSVNLAHAVDYQPTRVRAFRAMMRSLTLPPSSVFVDVGSGKGRLVLLASEFGFKRVVGIEFSRHLHEIAEENVKRYGEHRQILCELELINTDIADAELVHDENVFFLNNPFDSVVMEKFVRILTKSMQRNKRLVWVILHRHWETTPDIDALKDSFINVQQLSHGSVIFEVYLSHPYARLK